MYKKIIVALLLFYSTSLFPQTHFANTAVAQKLDYLPFGSERVNVKTAGFDTHFTFTDQEKDAESGLLYYGARYYHPVLGRFTQPDPVIMNIGSKEFAVAMANPQLLNPYAYVGNNPLRYLDPTGLGAVEAMGNFFYGFNYTLFGSVTFGAPQLLLPSPNGATQRLGAATGQGAATTVQVLGTVVGLSGIMESFSMQTALVAGSSGTITAVQVGVVDASALATSAGLAGYMLSSGAGAKWVENGEISAQPTKNQNNSRIELQYSDKIKGQMSKRGWDQATLEDVVQNPSKTGTAIDRTAGGEPATAYFDKSGNYVVVNNRTNNIVQISNRNTVNWHVDSSIQTTN
ncbi:MAG: hypothetical protein HY564_02650 [Candidatus Jacksonbacteria bacterium]|nr:hypothetical protein [Candidatus Jacksonbacteria bacterium]